MQKAMSDFVQIEDFEKLEDEGVELYKFRSYPGRGMYGRECLGFVGDLRDFAELIACLTDAVGMDEVWGTWTRANMDSMATEIIFYWPSKSLSQETKDWLVENYSGLEESYCGSDD